MYGQEANWSYALTPDGDKFGLKPKNPVTGGSGPLGNMIIYKRFECGNCTLRVNLMYLNVPPSDRE